LMICDLSHPHSPTRPLAHTLSPSCLTYGTPRSSPVHSSHSGSSEASTGRSGDN
jgi:hypothetical protein